MIEPLGVSAKLVYKLLEYEGPLTRQELIEGGWISEPTARSAVVDLKDSGLIEEQVYARESRQSLYAVAD